MKTDYPATPELDKQTEIIRSGKAALIGEFIDWLAEQHIGFWRHDEHGGVNLSRPDPEDLLAGFFGIDRKKIETERQAILAAHRAEDGG